MKVLGPVETAPGPYMESDEDILTHLGSVGLSPTNAYPVSTVSLYSKYP